MDGHLAQYLSQGEGIGLEFKRCGNQPGADVFETICSFANRQGGSLLLGVLDDGEVEGVPEPSPLKPPSGAAHATVVTSAATANATSQTLPLPSPSNSTPLRTDSSPWRTPPVGTLWSLLLRARRVEIPDAHSHVQCTNHAPTL